MVDKLCYLCSDLKTCIYISKPQFYDYGCESE